MIKDVTLTKVFTSDTKKDGTKLVTRTGKPYRQISIKTKEYGDKYLSNMIFEEDDDQLRWQEGEKKKIIVVENGVYLNFRVPSRLDILEERIEKLEAKSGPSYEVEDQGGPPDDGAPEISEDDIPF
jgi:hypothetical protein